MMAAKYILSALPSRINTNDETGLAPILDIVGGALLRSGIISLCFAIPLLAAYITLTVLQRKRASRANPSGAPFPNPVFQTVPPETAPAAPINIPIYEAPAQKILPPNGTDVTWEPGQKPQ